MGLRNWNVGSTRDCLYAQSWHIMLVSIQGPARSGPSSDLSSHVTQLSMTFASVPSSPRVLLIFQNSPEVLSSKKLFLNSPSRIIALLLSFCGTLGVFLVKYCASPTGIVCGLISSTTCELVESRACISLQGHLAEGTA